MGYFWYVCQRVKPVAFDDLLRLPLVSYYETAFRKATGVSLKLAPPEEPVKYRPSGHGENPFCALVARTPLGSVSCLEAEVRAHRAVAKRLTIYQSHCFAGLTIVALPVVIAGRHVATVVSGQVFRREPTQRDFVMVSQMLAGGLTGEIEAKARQAYLATPVVTTEQFQAIIQLLTIFVQYLTDYASKCLVAAQRTEPVAVVQAKEFVQIHVEEPVSLAQVAKHVNVSPFYFCKLFKKATGMTLTEYVARMRVEKAKTLLVDPSLRISEIVFAAGFGSIPRFNSVFKRYAGMPPTEYRATLRTSLVG